MIRLCSFNPSFYLKISCFYQNISQDLIWPCSINPNFYLKILCFIKISYSELDSVVLVYFYSRKSLDVDRWFPSLFEVWFNCARFISWGFGSRLIWGLSIQHSMHRACLLCGVVVCICVRTSFPLPCVCVCLFLQKKKKKVHCDNARTISTKKKSGCKKTKSHKTITNKKRITQELRNVFLDNYNILLIPQLELFLA